jgi:hypothetical protein
MAFAARSGDVLVLDGIAQLAPVRASLALLAVDADDPWGRGRSRVSWTLLRAPVGTLLGACDALVPMQEGAPVDTSGVGHGVGSLPVHAVWPARVESRGAWVDGGTLLTWRVLGAVRVGVVSALARPDRLLRSLARRGVVPRAVVCGRDHGPLGARARRLLSRAKGVDLWLATPKCALHAARSSPELPLAVLDYEVALHPALRNRLRGLRPR